MSEDRGIPRDALDRIDPASFSLLQLMALALAERGTPMGARPVDDDPEAGRPA